jgi:hypothetical protein
MVEVKSKIDLAYVGNEQVSDLLLTSNSISIIGTTEAATSTWISGNLNGGSDGFISSFSSTGTPLWSTRLGGANNEIATAAALDLDGSIWVVGASSLTISNTPTPAPSKLLNPDNVVVSPKAPPNSAPTKLNLWQVSPSGQLINSFETQTAGVINPQKILVSATGISVFGDIYEKSTVKGFLTTISKAGVFTPMIKYGVKQTQFTDAIANTDGSFSVVGKSADLLLKAKALSKGDAITLKISSKGALQQVARATLKSTTRSWDSISTGLLQGGLVKYSNKTEAAITKFSGLGKPVWNDRYLSKSTALVATGDNSWATFISSGAISGVASWKPKVATAVLLQLGKKGEVITASSFSGMPVAIVRNNEIGTVVITDSGTSFGLVLVN